MKTLFWNIGKTLTDRKLDLISEAISHETPDIFCLAEGSTSKGDCQKIIDRFSTNKYYCYYSPLFYLNDDLKLNYKYKRNGLKVFVRSEDIPSVKFSFPLQRQDGRIVILKTFIDFIPTKYIFIHNLSKSGNPEVTLDQISFIRSLVDMLEIKAQDQSQNTLSERTIIIGDFNLEPWDNVLRHKKYLSSNFLKIHDTLIKRGNSSTKNYFNPLTELIFHSDKENLGGTYYSNNSGWALFDYVLYDTNETNITYDVITEFGQNIKLLNQDNQIHKSFLLDDLDHLPISTKIHQL